MPIDPDLSVFPNNVVDLIYDRLGTIDSDVTMLKRPVQVIDGASSPAIGVFARQAQPQEDSREIAGVMPTLETYYVVVHSFVLDVDEEVGHRTSSVLSKLVYMMLYTDSALKLGLQASEVTFNGHVERFKRYGIRQVDYVNNEINKRFYFLATTLFWFDTEIT